MIRGPRREDEPLISLADRTPADNEDLGHIPSGGGGPGSLLNLDGVGGCFGHFFFAMTRRPGSMVTTVFSPSSKGNWESSATAAGITAHLVFPRLMRMIDPSPFIAIAL